MTRRQILNDFKYTCEKAQKQRLMELAGQLRSSVTIIRPGCRLLREDDVQVANLSGNGDLHQKIVLLVSL